jgi:2-(1,2-epoxy-1,2-dihydrophenyl)acetyl-CoA isomerase
LGLFSIYYPNEQEVIVETSYKNILFDIRDNVAQITLNRPEAANTFNPEMGTDLLHAIMRCGEDRTIRAVVITGAGRMFSGGGDIKGFATQGENLPYHLLEATTYLHAAVSRMTRMNPPVVAAVNGSAAGAGMSLACACDFVIAAESARFVTAYAMVGLTPDGSLTYFLPRIVGMRRALELTLTSRVLSAKEAVEWGIANKVVPDADLMTEAHALAVRLASSATKALGSVKRLLQVGWNETLETQMENESQSIAAISRTTDVAEGMKAFLSKRKAEFKGQ